MPKSIGVSFAWAEWDEVTKLDLFHSCLRGVPTNDTEKQLLVVLNENGKPQNNADIPHYASAASDVVVNVGGPIWNVEWCPTPQDLEGNFHSSSHNIPILTLF